MSANNRVEELRKYLGLSANALSKAIGLANPQIFYDIKAGKCGVSQKLAAKIQAQYFNISATWLMTGEGEMLLENREKSQNADGEIADLRKIIALLEDKVEMLAEKAGRLELENKRLERETESQQRTIENLSRK